MLISYVLPFATRAATAAFALLSIKLTHDFLSAQNFALLNYILFILAMSTALSSPIQRLFWAENSRKIFVVAVYSTCTISIFLMIILLGAYGFANVLELPTFLLIGCFAIVYGIYKITERYIYGQVMFDRSLTIALIIPALFTLLELSFVTFQYYMGWTSLPARVIGPVLLSVSAALVIPAFRSYLLSLMAGLPHFSYSVSIMIEQIFSAKGGKMLLFTIATTLAITVDRLVLGFVSIRNHAASADYLLALSYAIAIQTFLNVLIDLGRKRIYQNMAWVDGAKPFASKVFMLVVLLTFSLVLIFPLLKYFSIIPVSVSIYVWVVLILRSIAGFTINFSFTDIIQSGRISDAFIPILVLLATSLAFLFLLVMGIEDRMAAIFCGVPLIALSLVVAAGFHRRVPAT